MTTHTLQPARHLSPRTVGLGLGATALAVAVGFGVAALVVDDPAPATPTSTVVDEPVAKPGSDAYDGTDREVRELMHRRTP